MSHSSEENSSGSYEGQNTRELRHSIKRQNARIQEEILQKCKSAIETLTFEVEKHKIVNADITTQNLQLDNLIV